MMSNRTYDILKYIALKVLPALATLVLAVGAIWDIPYYEGIAGTITAFDAFLGAILGVSSNKYQAMQEMHEADEELANSPLYEEENE